MTLPACVISLPSDHICPAGQHWNGVECVADTITPSDYGDGSSIYLATDIGVAFSNNFLDASPNYVAINDGLSGDGLDAYRFLFDPFSNDGTQLKTAYLATKNGIYKNTNLPSGTWTQVLSVAQAEAMIGTNGGAAISHFTREMVLSILTQDYIGVAIRKSVNWSYAPQVFYAYSPNGGATWNCNTTYWWANDLGDTTHGGGSIPDLAGFFFPSNHTADTIYFTGDIGKWWGGDTSAQGRAFKSIDGGDTWSLLGAYSPGAGVANESCYTIIPYADRAGTVYADDTHAWRSNPLYDPGVYAIQSSTAFPGPYTPTPWTNNGVASMSYPWLFDLCTWSEKNIYLLSRTDRTNPIWSTQDSAANWNSSGNLGSALFYALSALPRNNLYCAVAGAGLAPPLARIYLTLTGGSSWSDQIGNLNTALPGITAIRSIVPDYAAVAASPVSGNMIDVSHYQGAMNWATAASQGITKTWLKASQGNSTPDAQYATNKAGTLANGIQRGAYHFYVAGVDPVAQANYFYAQAGTGLDLTTNGVQTHYAVDIEEISDSVLNNDTATNYKAFLDRMETLTGQKCTIYTRASYWGTYVGYQAWAQDYPLWIAHWNAATPTLPVGWSSWAYWQFSSQGNGAQYGAASAFIDLDKVNA